MDPIVRPRSVPYSRHPTTQPPPTNSLRFSVARSELSHNRGIHVVVEGIPSVRPVERDHADAVDDFDLNKIGT